MQHDVLLRLRRKSDFYSQGPGWVRSLWPTQAGFEWFCKANRDSLCRSGGLRRMGRDWFIDETNFGTAVASKFGFKDCDVQNLEVTA